MSCSIQATFPAELEKLPSILLWLKEILGQWGCPPKEMHKFELALEEIVVNIIRHGYRLRGGEVEIILRKLSMRIEVSVKDWAPPFNPLKSTPPTDFTAPLQKRKEGGIGIFLMRQIVDTISYERKGEANCLTFSKSTTGFSQKP